MKQPHGGNPVQPFQQRCEEGLDLRLSWEAACALLRKCKPISFPACEEEVEYQARQELTTPKTVQNLQVKVVAFLNEKSNNRRNFLQSTSEAICS